MELITCPSCGSQIPEQSTICPNCGHPLAPNTVPQQQQPKPKNNNAIIIALVAVACLALGALLALLLNRNSGKTENEPQSTEQITNSTAASATSPVPTTPSIPNDEYNGEVIPDILNEYVVSSYGGYGVYLRTRPSERAKTRKVYRDDTHFMGAPSKVRGYIMVIRNGRVIGYVPEEKVYQSGYNDYNDGYSVAQ